MRLYNLAFGRNEDKIWKISQVDETNTNSWK